MADQDTNLAEQIISQLGRLRGERGTIESHWKEIADRVLPRQSQMFFGQMQPGRTKGDKRTTDMLDATAALGLERFAAVMESMLTPRNSKWHRLQASEPNLNKSRRVRLWFEELNDALFRARYSPKANFAGQNHENFIGLGAFGTGCMFIDQNFYETGMRYKAVPLGTCWFEENHQGVVDTVFREFPMTLRQMFQRWPEAMPDDLRKKMEAKPEQETMVIHCVKPRPQVDHGRSDFRGMPFISHYIAVESKELLSEGGYRTFPYAVSRYVTAPGEVYGRSPAMLALPSIKTLNEQKKTVLKQGHRTVDPVLLAHDDSVVDGFSMTPGALNSGGVNAQGQSMIHTLPIGRVDIGRDMMNDERAVINDAFLVSLFQILADTPTMTATEVLERTREKGMLLSPTMGRQQNEYLGPAIEREIDLMTAQGMVPEMPPELLEAEGEYRVEYDSPLSRAQRAEEASGMFRSLEFATAHANVSGDVSVFDHFDMDIAVPEVMAINAVPERWKRSIEDVAAIREGRAEQAEQQQAVEAAPAIAGLVNAAS